MSRTAQDLPWAIHCTENMARCPHCNHADLRKEFIAPSQGKPADACPKCRRTVFVLPSLGRHAPDVRQPQWVRYAAWGEKCPHCKQRITELNLIQLQSPTGPKFCYCDLCNGILYTLPDDTGVEKLMNAPVASKY